MIKDRIGSNKIPEMRAPHGIRRPLFICVAAMALLLEISPASQMLAQTGLAPGREALRSGDYQKAQEYFEAALKAKSNPEDSQAGLLQAMHEKGAYREGATRADEFLATRETSVSLHLLRGRFAQALGDYPGAEKHFRRAIALAGASWNATKMDATRDLGDLLEKLGRKNEAQPLWEQLLDRYRARQASGSQELGDVAVAAWRRGYVQDAKDIFIDATCAECGPTPSLESLVNFGLLFVEKYNTTDAQGVFRDCLKINQAYAGALAGIAAAKEFEDNDEAEGYARAALEANPNFVPALNLLAVLHMGEENYDNAYTEVQKALAINPADLESLSLKAVYFLFKEDAANFASVEKQVLGINPGYGSFYHTLAESLVMRRKYREAVDYNRKAISLDPELWAAHASLGINLTRIGEMEEGRREIEKAFAGDPFNVWAFNSLDLMDQMDKFVQRKSEHFVFSMDVTDEPVLYPYLQKLAEEAYSKLSQRYGFTPKGPIRVELFPDHGGFAVRTVGLPGLGALGVCFGNVIAMDSPQARKTDTFNWGSTLWHEFAHVITLQATNHNIPRWYAEGLSVYEERRARPGWGDNADTMFFKAYQAGKLLKVSELNAGMMRPTSPEQIGLSYLQAASVCEMIEEKFGFEKIKQTLALFAENKTPAEVFRQALGWDPPAFDAEYERFLDARLKPIAARLNFGTSAQSSGPVEGDASSKQELARRLQGNPNDFFANLQMGRLLLKENDKREAETYLKKAAQLFPEFVEPGNPYQLLSEIYLSEQRENEALTELLAWSRIDENTAVPLIQAAKIYRNRKDWKAMAGTLESSVYIDPYDETVYAGLGNAAMEAGDCAAAAAAYQALLGMKTSDPARAHYDLARAWFLCGKKPDARREVLRSLEIAPSYIEAQELLLKLSGGNP